ncbi:Ribosomal RNA small subunit methyltransferase D [Candidatus Rhabdochlamydia oedothoracis]|uniref:Ribosomal RNA small subunit methyltransferase D n=1 Tax=Candidatus Rhabdochlamydia oedothoracis TaxID=2720720 RepID=A0ABX8UYB3_9BACT|nr:MULTISPECIES: 16S rRNA (guanine(966)-N(2))-methyltransferase RsmD [Rhabdochlamydia]KAG6559153.1 Ribosomal RNA small subunit methyltransferase D [Candidatus Rhabdochlamydia sp. W815]MCL6756437.1 16S rRNA (guanine(966)-N(2))-methyltransferase RsmD [Candidatus Rhabdochlamydia oedothoracis]QYF47953.1 Ribosomal RNA small subunit methyltransferase D [Candidatus Rhabdochlamydia oedothoracis]
MSLRILGGDFRGRLLKSPKTLLTRPTLAVLRKAVFDILHDKIKDALFLDLFAGSGAMGIEALSRGASHVTFVDKNQLATRCLKENIQLLQLEKHCSILPCSYKRALKQLVKKELQFDIAYIDPPYELSLKTTILQEIFALFDNSCLIKPNGIVFIEETAHTQFELKSFTFVNGRKFSDTLLQQYQRESTY